jgi:hypothetical protein
MAQMHGWEHAHAHSVLLCVYSSDFTHSTHTLSALLGMCWYTVNPQRMKCWHFWCGAMSCAASSCWLSPRPSGLSTMLRITEGMMYSACWELLLVVVLVFGA